MHARWIVLAAALVAGVGGPAAGDSLWRHPTEPAFSWFADIKARHVGDIVTVLIKEETKAKTDQTRSQTKTTSGLANIIRIFGDLSSSILGIKGYDSTGKSTSTPDPQTQWKSERKFDASAVAESKENLELRVSAIVKEVLPNGTLLIEGYREISRDGDMRRIYVAGLVRPQDIAADSTVYSERIAEARVRYESGGSAAATKNRGWGGRFMDMIWPF